MSIQLSPEQKELIQKGMSYSPKINKELESYNVSGFRLEETMNELYDCKNKLKVKVDGKCVDYKNEKAQEQMLSLLNYRGKDAIKAEYVIGPAQILSNCWLNSFFMCYFISDKGRKFFRSLRRTMITGEKTKGGQMVAMKYRKGLWLLNKFIQASLFFSKKSSKFIKHADTNDFIRLLRGKGEGKQRMIIKTKQAYNPIQFYENLFMILGMNNKRVISKTINLKEEYNLLFKNKKKKEAEAYIQDCEMLLIERRDDGERRIDSSMDKVKKEFRIGKSKFVLDSVVLRSKCKKHFTSYVTINGKEYAFEGGAHRRLREMKGWKDILTKGKDQTWKFGTPLRESRVSKPKQGYTLNEEFNFTKGYQILFYYRV